MTLLAELEVRHTRAVTPTRRVALGELWLPTDPPPGNGGLLLAAIVGAVVPSMDEERRDELDALIDDLEHGRRIAQPRLRYRFQTDTVGLDKSRHRLVERANRLIFEFDDHGFGMPQLLAAVYAASKLGYRARPGVFRLIRRAALWEGDPDAALVTYLLDDHAVGRRWRGRDETWAMTVLGFNMGTEPERSEILGRFRSLIRMAHPDHGAETDEAGKRISDLTEAKRILLEEPAS